MEVAEQKIRYFSHIKSFLARKLTLGCPPIDSQANYNSPKVLS